MKKEVPRQPASLADEDGEKRLCSVIHRHHLRLDPSTARDGHIIAGAVSPPYQKTHVLLKRMQFPKKWQAIHYYFFMKPLVHTRFS